MITISDVVVRVVAPDGWDYTIDGTLYIHPCGSLVRGEIRRTTREDGNCSDLFYPEPGMGDYFMPQYWYSRDGVIAQKQWTMCSPLEMLALEAE